MQRTPNIRVVEAIKIRQYAELAIQSLKELLADSDRMLEEAVNDLRAAAEDDDPLHELIRYLYWHSDLTPKKISELTGQTAEKLCYIAGPLVFMAACPRCNGEFVGRKTSRNRQCDQVCPSCQAADSLEAHRAFLLDWEDTRHLPPEVDRAGYSAYLQSPLWKDQRKRALRRAGFRCQVCSAKDQRLEVHHNSYDRLGRELIEDLCVLCSPCHRKIHNLD